MLDSKEKNAKGYYNNALEKQEISEYCYKTGKYKQMVSLDYYFIFNLCRTIYSLEYTDTSSHKKLMGDFNKLFIHEKKTFDKTVGSFLNTLEKQRNLCDYEANYPMDKDFAVYLHEQTGIVAELLKSYIEQNHNSII